MSETREKRRNPRVQTRFETISTSDAPGDRLPSNFASGEVQGIGILANISYTGARLERTEHKPALGSCVRIEVFLSTRSGVWLKLEGKVVRHTRTGFAIEYAHPSPELCRLVDDAASLV